MSCGAGLASGCHACGAALPHDAVFCPACGTRAGASEQNPPVAAMETIKLVTILFADVVGSTAQAEQLSPDEVRALMADFFEAMIEEITAEGGTVERLIGDAIMADFGVPIAREDDPVRAVRSARRMLERLDRFNKDNTEQLHIQIRIGINTGQVSTGGSLGERLMVMGDSVNVAARLQQHAEPGTIAIGERTAHSVRQLFDLRELPAISAKGKSEPVRAFTVEREREQPSEVGPSTPLVGRASELDRLTAALRAVERDRKPHVVTIVGEPGAGKTRLVSEFVAASDAHTLIGRCAPLEGGLTLWPLREILRELAGLSSDDSPPEALGKILDLTRTLPGDLISDPDRTAAALGSTIGLRSALEAFSGLDPREVQRAMFAAWAALFSGLARKKPLIVLVDDIHWADATTLEMLAYVATTIDESVLFLCPARTDFTAAHSDWMGSLRDLTAINLDPLEDDEGESLATLLLEGQGVEATLAGSLAKKAGGNPLFIRELALCLTEGGRGTATQASGGAEIEVPDSIQAVIQARLDLLPAEQRLVTQKAAVVGRSFWESIVCRISGMKTIEAAIQDLTQRQLVVERIPSSLEGEAEFGFAHMLIRDVAYDSLPRRVRGETHAQVAVWLEERRGERITEFAEILTGHYASAFELLKDERHRGRARGYALVAARNALRRYAVDAAERHGNRAVSLSEPGSEKVEALEAIGDLYLLTHRSQGAYEAYRDALTEQHAEGVEDSRAVARLAGKAAIVATRWWGTMDQLPPEEELRDLIRQGLDACGSERNTSRARLLASHSFACALGFDFASEATETARAAVQVAEESGEADLISMAHDALAASLFPVGGWQEIHEINLRRVELVPRLSDIREICDAYGMTAVSSARKGLCGDAQRFAAEEITRAKDIDAGSYLQGLVWHSVACFLLGDWQQVFSNQVEIERMQPGAPALPGAMAMRAYVVTMLCHELRGETNEASRYLSLFDEYDETERARGFTLGGLPEAARVLARRGDFDRARELLPLQHGEFLSLHLGALCEVVLRQQAWEDAEPIALRALAEHSSQGLPLLAAQAYRLQGASAIAAGDTDKGRESLGTSASQLAALGARWEEALSRLLLAETLHEEGDPEGIKHARLAGITFEDIGSVQELQRAQRITGLG